jgi:hypothetical protein
MRAISPTLSLSLLLPLSHIALHAYIHTYISVATAGWLLLLLLYAGNWKKRDVCGCVRVGVGVSERERERERERVSEREELRSAQETKPWKRFSRSSSSAFACAFTTL